MTDPQLCIHVHEDGPSLESVPFNQAQTNIINCKNRYLLGVRETSEGKTLPPPLPKRLKDASWEKF